MFRLLPFLICLLFTVSVASAQNVFQLQPEQEYENVFIQKLFTDSLASTFIIWVKKEVPLHKHEWHTEQVYVISGKGAMTVGKELKPITAGDIIFIPKNTPHAVKVTSAEPLKVISIQAPEFDGSDRIIMK